MPLGYCPSVGGSKNGKIELFYFVTTGWLQRSLSALRNHQIARRWWGRDDWATLKDLPGHHGLRTVWVKLGTRLNNYLFRALALRRWLRLRDDICRADGQQQHAQHSNPGGVQKVRHGDKIAPMRKIRQREINLRLTKKARCRN